MNKVINDTMLKDASASLISKANLLVKSNAVIFASLKDNLLISMVLEEDYFVNYINLSSSMSYCNCSQEDLCVHIVATCLQANVEDELPENLKVLNMLTQETECVPLFQIKRYNFNCRVVFKSRTGKIEPAQPNDIIRAHDDWKDFFHEQEIFSGYNIENIFLRINKCKNSAQLLSQLIFLDHNQTQMNYAGALYFALGFECENNLPKLVRYINLPSLSNSKIIISDYYYDGDFLLAVINSQTGKIATLLQNFRYHRVESSFPEDIQANNLELYSVEYANNKHESIFNRLRFLQGWQLLENKQKLIDNGFEIAKEIPDLHRPAPYLVLTIFEESEEEDENETLIAPQLQATLLVAYHITTDADDFEISMPFKGHSHGELVKVNPANILYRNYIKERKLLKKKLDINFVQRTGQVRLPKRKIAEFIREKIPTLEKKGVLVRIHADLLSYLKKLSKIRIDIEASSGINWFEGKIKIPEVNQQEMKFLMKAALRKQEFFRLKNGSWISIQEIGLEEAIKALSGRGLKVDKEGNIDKIPIAGAFALETDFALNTDKRSKSILKRITDSTDTTSIKSFDYKKGLKAKLHPYQKTGVMFFKKLYDLNLGGILADEMGLGKTLQALAFINWFIHTIKSSNPILLVTPLSAISVWTTEAEKFFDDLYIHEWHGINRDKNNLKKRSVHITTYATLAKSQEEFTDITFSLIFLDEAQFIKNHLSLPAKTLRTINYENIFCLTGTPFENRLAELWSLIDLCAPGLLGTRKSFVERFRENQAQVSSRKLKEILKPFILRRHKADVFKELPDKVEKNIYLDMPRKQEVLYEKLRQQAELEFKKAENGPKKLFLMLTFLTKLRRAAIHSEIKQIHELDVFKSAKLLYLQENLESLSETSSGILIFSQFTDALKCVATVAKRLKLDFFYLDGSTTSKKRKEFVARFQKGERKIFLISLKAGGSALTLHKADTIIHLDPWWNPQAENQATDRAHRIGQEKTVFVYRLITKNTVEEKVMTLKDRKQVLFDSLFSDQNFKKSTTINEKDIAFLLKGD